MKSRIILSLTILFLLSACAFQGATDEPVQTESPVVETLAPTDPPAPTESPEPTATLVSTGTVTGRICYPSEFIPEMTVFFKETESGMIYHFLVEENQDTYEVEMPVGTFLVFAFRNETLVGGGYTPYVAAGYDESVTDHSLLPVAVAAGSRVEGIDICDWVLTDLPLPEVEGETPLGGPDPLAGLVYRTPDGLWMIGTDGVHSLVMDIPDSMVLSSEGFVYVEGDDIFLYDTNTRSAKNLTNTPDRIETLWTGDSNPPGGLLFTSFPNDFELGPGITGFLTYVNLDGTGYEILDEEHHVWHFDVSPDGTRVAYGLGAEGWIYDLETGARSAFNAADYGLGEITTLGSPAWSPDGTRIAWVAGFQSADGQPFTFGLAVFDLVNGNGQILHPHEIPGMDGYPPAAAWRPDGEWLVYTVFDVDFERGGIWLLKTDGSAELRLSPGGNPVWRLDGQVLVYLDSSQGQLIAFDAVSLESTVLDFDSKAASPVTWLP